MNKRRYVLTLVLALIGPFGSVSAADRSGFDELSTLIDSARVLEADIFAPKVWQKVEDKFADARKSVEANKNQKTIDKLVAESREYTENAIKTTGVGRLSLQEYLSPREKAIKAMAVSLVPELYQKAEIQFMKATAKVESGDVKGGLKEAAKSTPLFDAAELEAIRVDILGTADRLIEKAVADDAEKFALSTLDKARTARKKSDAIITADRYSRAEAAVEAARAEYEARHASNIGLSVRSLKRNDQAWEKLMLVYEIQMNRVGEAIGAEHLPFDEGPLAAADTLINYIRNLKASSRQVSDEMGSLSADVNTLLRQSLSRLEVSPDGDDPVSLADALDRGVSAMLLERDSLQRQLLDNQTQLATLTEEHDIVAGQLSGRLEQEEKFKQAKMKLNPSEGAVLYNSSNDIVLRLGGLSFDIGKFNLKDDHVPLLEKVKEIIQMFPETKIMVEGHTDASGESAANVTLSEKRAFEVMQYLRQTLLISAERIKSMGFGSDRPIASNQTSEGRAKNRRIDIILMR